MLILKDKAKSFLIFKKQLIFVMVNSIITHLKQKIEFAKPNKSLKYILLYLYIPMQSVPLSLRAEANKSENLAPKEAYLEKYKNT